MLRLAITALVLPVSSLNDEVRIHYDSLATPHIYADTDAAAFYGLGYQQMRDFPVTTLTTLWAASGRMAEIVGRSAIDLDADLHQLDIGPQAAAQAADLAATIVPERADILARLEDYVAGINRGRAWWQETPGALDSIAGVTMGGDTVMHVEPITYFLSEVNPSNPGNRGEGAWEASAALARLFEEEITVDHVLRVGILFQRERYVWNQFPGPYSAFESPQPSPQPEPPPLYRGSEGWLATSDEEGTFTYACPHFPFHRAGYRGYAVQIEGPTYRVSGLCVPGSPAILMGFNQDVSWWNTNDSATPFDRLNTRGTGRPNTPSLNGYYGAAATTVLRNQWRALMTVEGAPTGFRLYHSEFCKTRRSQTCPSDLPMTIERTDVPVSYFDYATGELAEDPVLVTREWVVPSAALGLPRFPISAVSVDPNGNGLADFNDEIVFDQFGAALETRSPWEFLIRMGRSPSVTGSDPNCVQNLVEAENLSFGGAGNLCAADDTGGFYYSLVGAIPKQGTTLTLAGRPEVRPWLHPDNPVLSVFPGDLKGYHWLGLHPLADLPQLSDVSTTDKIWVMNNSTPNYINHLQSTGSRIDLTAFHDYITDHGNDGQGYGTARQWDVEDLLSAAAPISLADNHATALSMRDPWSVAYWPYFYQFIRDHYAPSSAAADFAVNFVDAFKREKEDGETTGGPEFIAHTASRVMPYMTLLRSYFESQVFSAYQDPGLAPDSLDLLFAIDPFDPNRPTPVEVSTSLAYELTQGWMMQAIDSVVALKRAERAAGGLANQVLLMTGGITSIPSDINLSISSTVLDPDPFNQHPWDIPPPAYHFFADGVLRWGHCQWLVATPHFDFLFGDASAALESLAWQVSFYSSVWPEQFERLPGISSSRFTNHGYFTESRVGVWPIGGVAESVFATAGMQINANYQNAVAEINDEGANAERFYLLQFTSAGSVIWTVDLGPQDGQTANVGYYRCVNGATDLTTDITQYAGQTGDEFFASSEAYARGVWTPLNVPEGPGDPRHTLSYAP